MDTALLYSLFIKHPVIATDSREIPEGSIFFALKGQNFDGNKFALTAIEKGAAYAVIDNPKYAQKPHTILVDDVLHSLQLLANYHRKQLKAQVLAITGTNGKTTTKELIASVLKQKYKTTFTQGNLNNHIGVPLTLLSMTTQTEIAIVEMGANHPREIASLCEIAEPNYGIVTNIGKAHLEGFGSFEGVIKTKTELYDYLRNNKGRCFINSDNPLLLKQAEGLEQFSYGTSEDAQLYGKIEDSTLSLTISVLFPKGWLYIKSKLIGSYNYENLLAAASVGMYFSVDPLNIQKAIESYQPSNNRSQLIKKGSNQIIMDAYNANPTSMLEALKNFASIKHPLKTLILGDMLELGKHSMEEHQKIANFIESGMFNKIYLIGECFSAVEVEKTMKKFNKIELLHAYLSQQNTLENNLILIKGSRGIQLEKILDIF